MTDFAEHTKKYAEHQIKSEYISQLLEDTEYLTIEERAELSKCGEYLMFSNIDGKYKLVGASFCRKRICPMCQWRKSEKQFSNCIKMADYLEEQGYCFLHMVLTIPNCNGGIELTQTVKKLYSAFAKLIRQEKPKKAFKGIIRALEISYNYDRRNFHPHLHCLVVVNKSYFNDTKSYISYEHLAELWRKCLGTDEFIQVSIGRIKDKMGFAEVSKYCIKPLDFDEKYNTDNLYIIGELYATLKGTRFLQYYGVCKEARKVLKLNDDIESEATLDSKQMFTYHYNYHLKKYQEI